MEEELITKRSNWNAVVQSTFSEDYVFEEVKEKSKEINNTISDALKEYCKDKLITNKTKVQLDTQYFHYDNQNNCLYLNIGNVSLYSKIHKNYDLSCGHRSFTNLSTNYKYEEILKYFKEEYHATVLIDIYRMIFDFIKKELKCQFILVSNNNASGSSIINNIIDKLSRFKTSWENNPNSGNTIAIFII